MASDDELTLESFLALTPSRCGHFRIESGYHTDLWLDLDSLFAVSRKVDPFVRRLTESIRPYDVDAICGPRDGGAVLAELVARALDVDAFFTEPAPSATVTELYAAQYRLPASAASKLGGRRIAIVDDTVSAGSALNATYGAVRSSGGIPVVAASLLLLGTRGEGLLKNHGLPVEAVVRGDYTLWLPSDCPLCAAGRPLDSPAVKRGVRQ
jgi:orotate phosphoribosyltransferase